MDTARERRKDTAKRPRTHLPRLVSRRRAPASRGLGLAALMAAAAVALAACGGSKGPQVASLAANNAGASTTGAATSLTRAKTATKSAKGNPTALIDEWATCMQSHGDPNQAAPTIDAYGVINVTIPAGAAGALQLSNAVHAGTGPCNQYMAAAQAALRAANPVAPPPDQAEQVKYVNCMRANGVPNYPYPTANMTFQGTGVDPNSPAVMRANDLCGRKLNLPAWWVSGNGEPGEVSVSNVGPNGTSNPGQPPPCFYAKTGCPNGGRARVSGGTPPVQPGG